MIAPAPGDRKKMTFFFLSKTRACSQKFFVRLQEASSPPLPPSPPPKKCTAPTNIGITRGTPSVTVDTIVVVGDGVTVWVALKFSYH